VGGKKKKQKKLPEGRGRNPVEKRTPGPAQQPEKSNKGPTHGGDKKKKKTLTHLQALCTWRSQGLGNRKIYEERSKGGGGLGGSRGGGDTTT